jgi:hypothetical protein
MVHVTGEKKERLTHDEILLAAALLVQVTNEFLHMAEAYENYDPTLKSTLVDLLGVATMNLQSAEEQLA